jgi:hypothetical protein
MLLSTTNVATLNDSQALMPNYSKKTTVSEMVKEDAIKMARATQRPGQTREQTKLIAQGIQKGIEQYKKLQKEKARELDKRLNKASAKKPSPDPETDNQIEPASTNNNKLPWILLALSWLGFAAYLALSILRD